MLVYTEGMRKVREVSLGAVPAGAVILKVPAFNFAGLTKGAYYTVVTGIKHGGGNTKSAIKTLLIFY